MIGRVADYDLLEQIGRGGMGVVFKGRNPRLGNVVAVKILLDELARDPEYRARFLREARAEAQLHHTSIAACFDVGEGRLEPPDLLDPGGPGPHPDRVLYLVMEYVPGTDLRELIGDRPLAIPRVLDLAIQIAAGLESAHKAGVIHRDLKSTNIRVMPDDQVKIVDFGLSRIERADRGSDVPALSTSLERVMGTMQFMAPEQARGRTTDRRSDLFSLGVILYELVTGRLPFTGGTSFEIANAVASEDPPPLARYASGVPDELERIMRKLIAKDPDHRYQSAHEVRTDLERLRSEMAESKSKAGRPSGGWLAGRRRLTAAVVAVVAVVVLGLSVLSQWLRPPEGIAVMPFDNRTGDPRLDYLGDGMAASLVGDLVRGGEFNVASLTAVRSVDPAKRGVGAIARELGVGAIVEGSLRREGNNTYLDVQLTDGRRGFVLWMNRFSYAVNGAADIEQEIVRQVAVKLDPRRTRTRAATAVGVARSPSAYDLYLRGGSFLEDPDDPQGADKALEYYTQSLDADPNFALAWAGESRALWKIWIRDKKEESIRRAEEAANHAIRLNPELLEARLARAQIYRATSRYAESIRELEDVLRINPRWNDALIHLSASYRDAGDMVRALATQRRAVEQQPGYWRNWNQLGSLLFRLGKYPEAAAAFREVIRLIPEKNLGYEQLGAMETKQGNFAAAMAAYQRMPSPVASGLLAANIGTAYYFEGQLDIARRFYELAVGLDPRAPSWRAALGDLHAREGKADSARADYQLSVDLIGGLLHVDPRNVKLKLDRAVLLAKLGQCDTAHSALAEISGDLPKGDAQCVLQVAKLHAVCGRTAEAIEAVREVVALGEVPAFLRKQDEFAGLARDPRFEAALRKKS